MLNSTKCEVCPEQAVEVGRTRCHCSDGYTWDRPSNTCEKCPDNFYSKAGDSNCTVCPEKEDPQLSQFCDKENWFLALMKRKIVVYPVGACLGFVVVVGLLVCMYQVTGRRLNLDQKPGNVEPDGISLQSLEANVSCRGAQSEEENIYYSDESTEEWGNLNIEVVEVTKEEEQTYDQNIYPKVGEPCNRAAPLHPELGGQSEHGEEKLIASDQLQDQEACGQFEQKRGVKHANVQQSEEKLADIHKLEDDGGIENEIEHEGGCYKMAAEEAG